MTSVGGALDALENMMRTKVVSAGQAITLGLDGGTLCCSGFGANRLAHAGLSKRLVGGYDDMVPLWGRRASRGQVQAYNPPLGYETPQEASAAARRP